MNLRIVTILAITALLAPGALAGPRTTVDLAYLLLTLMEVQPVPCAGTFVDPGPDRNAVCAKPRLAFKTFKKSFEQALHSPDLAPTPFLVVTQWEPQGDARVKSAYWLGAASIEVVLDKKTSELAIVGSKVYPRCGNDVRFVPQMMSRTGEMSLELMPTGYPRPAARGKVDGSVALAVDVDAGGVPVVRCIHHASPAGYGFEIPAIDAVRDWNDPIELSRAAESGEPVTVVVRFSKADQRRTSEGVKYH